MACAMVCDRCNALINTGGERVVLFLGVGEYAFSVDQNDATMTGDLCDECGIALRDEFFNGPRVPENE